MSYNKDKKVQINLEDYGRLYRRIKKNKFNGTRIIVER